MVRCASSRLLASAADTRMDAAVCDALSGSRVGGGGAGAPPWSQPPKAPIWVVALARLTVGAWLGAS